MNQKVVNNIFNYLYSKKIFSILITGFAIIGFGSWIYLSSAIDANINYRLEKELTLVTSNISNNLNNYAGTLAYVQAYFRTEGTPNQYQFRKLSESIEIQRVNHGLQGIGYISIVKKNHLSSFINAHKRRPFFRTDWLKPGREIYAPVTMIEPMNWRRTQMLGYDFMLTTEREKVVLDAIKSASISMTPILQPIVKNDPDPQTSIMLVSPVYTQLQTPATPEDRLKNAKGLVYIPVRTGDFLERIFGKPNKNEERINFTIEVIDPKLQTATLAYQRFDIPLKTGSISKSRVIDLYGQKWKISVTPFPLFFNFGDLYLVNTVAAASIIFIILLFSIFNQTQNLLAHEKKSKDVMLEAVRQSLAQTAQLKRLNEINKHTALELDLKNLIEDFFQASLQISHSSHAFLYCSSTPDNPEVVDFHASLNFGKKELVQDSLTLTQLNSLLEKNLLKKSEEGNLQNFSKFIYGPDHFTDWIFVTIPSREFRQCGLLFLARAKGEKYSENDLEIMESMVSQVGIGIDNSRLFKKVEDSNRVKTAFLSNMSHEIRTPLNAITGFSEILCKTVEPAEKNSLMESIKKNTSQLTSIIDNILDISKVEFGRIYINKENISLLSIVEEIKWVMEMRAKAKGITFHIEGLGKLPAFVETDESRVKQILINLIGNAIKFTETGSVKLQIKCEPLSLRSKDYQLLFIVIDTGIGISALAQQGLFQSFSQADISSTRRFGGVGLGLALSKRLAQQFGGDVSLINSRLENGSIFQFKIPAGKAKDMQWKNNLFENIQNPAEHSLHKTEATLKNKNVLIIEDSEDNQEIFKYFLKAAGATSDIIDNGEDAVQQANHDNYDLILMDIQLPKMDGMEATRRIRAKGYKKPIIALTAHSSPEEKANCLKAGCVDLITKPVTQETLIKQILFILEENKSG
ncbi:MAG: response regulator [Bdellovibrio sp.]|nr:response regulator [Bdellovibrio sp.]